MITDDINLEQLIRLLEKLGVDVDNTQTFGLSEEIILEVYDKNTGKLKQKKIIKNNREVDRK